MIGSTSRNVSAPVIGVHWSAKAVARRLVQRHGFARAITKAADRLTQYTELVAGQRHVLPSNAGRWIYWHLVLTNCAKVPSADTLLFLEVA